ncbi:PREDICTED: uncharacterized protein LOC104779327 [Camelina sativa]|uniref:Uncharacterized protein LOC104779327 n=1 Tax=Camelina sativa TaxID=90675 RepID=A0ABM0YJK2_CAMSA|nr:PREDICTED: uncharacterized protein LOC104779327 [Camelina sativa]
MTTFKIDFILEGLTDDFKTVVYQIEGRDTSPSFVEVYEKFLNYESKLAAKATAAPVLPATAHNVSYRGSNSNNRHHGRSNNRNTQSSSYRPNYTPRLYNGKCQICGVHGHSARRCSQLQLHASSYTPGVSPVVSPTPWQPRAHMAAANMYNAGNWIVDSSATHHLTSDLNNLALHQPYTSGEEVTIADGSGLPITRIGSAILPTPTGSLTLKDVLYVPDVQKNLISVYRMCNTNGVSVHFFPAYFQVNDFHTGVPFLQGRTKNELYEWPVTILFARSFFASLTPKTVSVDNFKYYLVIVDHFTRYTCFYPLKLKSHVRDTFTTFTALVENKFWRKIDTLYSDNGGEFIALHPFLTAHGITHLTTPPHTPEHNGISERKHRHVVETGLTLLSKSSMPMTYWTYAFSPAVYLINRMPTSVLGNESPYVKLFGSAPNYQKLRIFGCMCFPWLRPYTPHKLAAHSAPCVFLGYSLTQSAYLCLDRATRRIYTSRHVQFDETLFPFATPPNTQPRPSSPDQTPDTRPTYIHVVTSPLSTALSSSPPVQPPSCLDSHHTLS